MLAGDYLAQFTEVLALSLARQPQDFRSRHVQFLSAQQCEDGGFRGRAGGSDIYYTSFALRGLACLRGFASCHLESASVYIRDQLGAHRDLPSILSTLCGAALIRDSGGADPAKGLPADWVPRLLNDIEAYRTEDGGYGKTPQAKSGSTYHSFLAAVCYHTLQQDPPGPEAIIDFLCSRQREDGGFVEIAQARRSGTNPTAAAIALFILLDVTTQPTLDRAADFLAALQDAGGGLRANTRAPLADLLSTFTASLTLARLGRMDAIRADAAHRFVRACEDPHGGFRAGPWDSEPDVEYAFYGLAMLGLLAGA